MHDTKGTEVKPPALYIYTAGGQYKRALSHVCKHEENISLLVPTIQGQGYLVLNELLVLDKTGRTPICLAQTERKQEWNRKKNNWMAYWVVAYTDILRI